MANEEIKQEKNEEFQEVKKKNYIQKIKKTLTSIVNKEFLSRNLKYFKNKKILVTAGTIVILSVFGFTLNKYFQLKKEYNILNQQHSQLSEENKNIKQEYEQEKQENAKTSEALTQLDKIYQQLLTKNEQINQQYIKITEENKQLQQQSQESSKKLEELAKKHEKLSQENSLLTQKYQAMASENEELRKKQEELRKKEAKTLKELTEEHVSLTKYSLGYGFPNYKIGLLDKQNNWISSDSLDKKGWQVINKKITDALIPSENNVLSFLPTSTFSTFSPEDNYATLHLHSDKPIKTFSLGGEYNIQKNGWLEVHISADNKNWAVIDSFNSRNQNNYRFGYFTPYNIAHFPELKIDKDLFIRHSSGTISNQNYEIEIWRFSASVTTE